MSSPGHRQRRVRVLWCLSLVAVCLAAPLSAWAAAGIDAGKSATVAIRDRREGIYGSGVVLAPEYVLTAAHVVNAASDYGLDTNVVDAQGVEHDGEIEAVSRTVDLALLHVPGLGITPIGWGTPGTLGSGDEVYALGYPLGMESISVTKGIVSAPSQEIEGDTYVQTDASINPGNSGGPLVDSAGRLIGINVMKMAHSSVDNIGFAVPLEAVEGFLADAGIAIPALAPDAASEIAGGGTAVPQSGGILLLGAAVAAAAAIGAVVYTSKSLHPAAAGPSSILAPTAAVSAPAGIVPASSFAIKLALRTEGGQASEIGVTLPAVIGRDSTADVRVHDGETSRHHARLFRSGSDVIVQDLSSTNGVIFRGRKEPSFALPIGEAFEIGRTIVRRVG